MQPITPIGQSTGTSGVSAVFGSGHGSKVHKDGMAAVASLLGESTQQLQKSMAGGQSLAQVLQAAGKTTDQGAQAYLSGVQAGITADLAAGKITSQQATNIIKNQTNKINSLLGTTVANPGVATANSTTSTASLLSVEA